MQNSLKPYSHILHALADGKTIQTDSTIVQYQVLKTNVWRDILPEKAINSLSLFPPDSLRVKPHKEMHIINGFEVPKGLTEKPMCGKIIFVEFANDKSFHRAYPWFDESQDNRWLERGIVHSDKDSAVQSCKARLGIDPYKMIVIKK